MIDTTRKQSDICDDIRDGKLQLNLTAELSDCPFCGGRAVAEYSPGVFLTPAVIVRCTCCGMKTPMMLFLCGGFKNGHSYKVHETEAIEQAVKVWNTRTAADQ